MNKLLFISGARPNIIKLAPLYKILTKDKKNNCKILHSNQHSNKALYRNIYKDLNLPYPHYQIKKFNTHKRLDLIAYFIKSISKKIKLFRPKLVILFGDVDTTLASGIAARNLGINIMHVESGLRSRDLNAHEEINRRIVDHLSDINLATTKNAYRNLINEGLKNSSHNVGNIIFDNYYNLKKKILASKILNKINIKKKNYILITIHRYQTIDNVNKLKKFVSKLNVLSKNNRIIFSCHTRTQKNLKKINLLNKVKKISHLLNPQPYTDFKNLLINSKLVITDSGGVQEECFFHNKKCLVLRDEFERGDFLKKNLIFKVNIDNITKKVKNKDINFKSKKIHLWDGKVSKRIKYILKKYLNDINKKNN